MPLFDSLSTAQSYRLPKMNSVPTTDDLKYAIAEGQKRVGKLIELPFEHPHNHQFFIVKLVLSIGNKQPPSWTLVRGDGASGVKLWNRNSPDVLMIQNAIKIDSQQTVQSDGTVDASAASGRPMSMPTSFDNPFGGGAPPDAGPLAPPKTDAMDAPSFYESANKQFADAFAAPQQLAPQNPGQNWMDNLPQAPVFNPNASKTGMAAMKPMSSGVPAAPQMTPPQMVPPQMTPGPQVSAPPDADEFLEPEESKAPEIALPPPIKLDVTLIDRTIGTFQDPNSGIDSLASFVYFLFREQALFQRSSAPFSVVVFECAMRIGHENIPLPVLALPAVIERIRTVVTEYDSVTHLSGGEFAALLPGVNAEGVAIFSEALHTALTTEPLTAGNRNEAVLAAIGMATLPNTCEDPEVLIAAARQAKESAKSLPHPILMFPST